MDRDYRTKEELDAWIDKCPVKRSRENLISKNIATSAQLETWEFEIQHSVDEDIAKAYEDPWPKASELLENSNAIF
jgi:pyruvate dehydrogenase E1 component alpha subunit